MLSMGAKKGDKRVFQRDEKVKIVDTKGKIEYKMLIKAEKQTLLN